MKTKKGDITIEALTKAAFILFLAIVVFAVAFSILRPSFKDINDKKNETEPGTNNIFNILSNMLGGCSENEKRCVGDRLQICTDGKWETSKTCSKGCDKERRDCE